MTDIFFGGGLNENDDLSIDIQECFEGQNFKLDGRDKHFHPRPPFDLKGTTTNAQPVTSIMQLIKRDGTITQLVASGNTVYNWNGATTFTSVATVITASRLRGEYWSLDDRLVVTDIDLANTIQQWDGTTFKKNGHGIGNGTIKSVASLTRSGNTASAVVTANGYSTGDLVTIAGAVETDYNGEFIILNATTDGFDFTVANSPGTPATGTITAEKSVDLYARGAAVWNNRTWLFNIKDVNGATTSLNPHMILASFYNDADIYDTVQTVTATGLTGNEAFFLLTPDLRPINSVVAFYNAMLISTTDGRLFKLTGSDSSNYSIDEYFPGSSAIGYESMVGTGNDIVYMRKDGGIDFVGSVDSFGDIKSDDVSRFIPNQTIGLTGAIVVYDQLRQKIHFFVANKILVLDKEMINTKPDLSPWSVYITDYGNSFNTSAALYMKHPSSDGYDVYWGDSSGRLFNLNGTSGQGDGGTTAIETKRKSRSINEIDVRHKNIQARAEYRRKDACTVDITTEFGEEFSTAVNTISLKARSDTAPYFGGDVYFNEAVYFNDGAVGLSNETVSTLGFSPPGKGNMFFIEVKAITKSDFLINRLIF